MKKYSFLFPIASLCWCLFGCNEDSGFGIPEGDVENVVPQQGDIVSMPMNTEDSAFFSSLLPSLERNKVMRIDSRDELSTWLPDSLLIPDDLDFERYTYLLGCAELHSPSYYVKQDTLVYASGRFEYLFDYFYSPSDASSVRLICGKYVKFSVPGGVSLSIDGERGLGLVYSTEILGEGLSTPDFNMEDREFALIRMIPDLYNYIQWPEAWNYPFFFTVDYSRYSVILWKRKFDGVFLVSNPDFKITPLSPVSYLYEVTHKFTPSLIGEPRTSYVVSVIDKITDDVQLECVFNDIVQ